MGQTVKAVITDIDFDRHRVLYFPRGKFLTRKRFFRGVINEDI